MLFVPFLRLVLEDRRTEDGQHLLMLESVEIAHINVHAIAQ